jgi:hypothetical protein
MKRQTKILIFIGALLLVVVFAAQWVINSKQSELQVPASTSQAVVTIAESITPTRVRVMPTTSQNSGQNTAQIQPTNPAEKNIPVTVVFSEGKKYEETVFAQNAFMALQEIAKIHNFPIVTKDYKYGKMVEKVGDLASDAQNFWGYSVNGKMGNVAGNMYVLHPNDTVEWKYTKINK